MAASDNQPPAGSLSKQDLTLFAYNLWDGMVAFFESEEGKKEFAEWRQEQQQKTIVNN